MNHQRSGIHPNLEFKSIEGTEEKIIRHFSSVWFITFLKRQIFKSSDYTFAFARPSDHLIERYHFEREILILLTPYDNFDTRSLDFVDKIIFEYQNRLDKLLVFLVSGDVEVEEKIRNVVLQDQESRIIIPFSYDEFDDRSSKDGLIEDKIKKFFFTRDLFSFNSPLKSENYFFGRSDAINNFYDKYRTGENSGLFGLRKIGKTSTLYAIKRLLDVRGEPSIFIDCQDPAFHMRNWNEALEYIISEGAKQLNFLSKKKLHIDNGYDKKNASTHFEEDLNELSKQKSNKRILLIFDEIENITFEISPSDHWAHGDDFMYFWQAIRSIFQKNPGLFSFVIAGVNPKCVEEAIINERDNPIYKMIRPNYLKFFTSNQVKEMVSTIGMYMGVEFDDEIYTYLSDDYGGHPFLVRDVCSFLVKKTNSERPARVSKFLYEENKEQLNLLLNDYLELILNVLQNYYLIEYDLLAHLAAEDYETFKEFAIEFSNCISHLLGYGIVEQQGSKYFFKLKSIKEYINNTFRLKEKIEKKNESKWAVISRRRNKLEPQLRKIIEVVFIPRFGSEDAKVRFLNKIGGTRAKKLEKLSFGEILGGSKESEIYLDDLRKIILGYWDYFEKLFGRDREKFDYYLIHINKFRSDAHSNKISEDDYSFLISAFDWFENQIKGIPFMDQ